MGAFLPSQLLHETSLESRVSTPLWQAETFHPLYAGRLIPESLLPELIYGKNGCSMRHRDLPALMMGEMVNQRLRAAQIEEAEKPGSAKSVLCDSEFLRLTVVAIFATCERF